MSGKHGRQPDRQPDRQQRRRRGGNSDALAESPRQHRDAAPSHARHGSASARIDVAGDLGAPAAFERGGRTATIEAPPRVAESSFDGIAPLGGGRRAAREEQRGQNRKRALLVGAGVVVVALIVWAISAGTGKSAKNAPAVAAAGRTQTTLLVQVKDATGAAVDSALVAHDSATHSGAVVLVPSAVIGQVPGFGPMAFGQALLVGQPNAPRATLSDLMGVTIDGSLVLTT